MPELRIKFDRHGLGDCVHFAHALQLYKRRGYDITVQAEENKLFIWKVAGVNIVQGGGLPDHSYHYPAGFDDLSKPDHETNKVAFGLRNEIMPPLEELGLTQEQAWDELCAVRLSAHDYISPDAHAEAERFLEGMPRPIICFHSRGTNWHERKSLSTELAFDVIVQLLDQTGGSVIVLDYDRRAPMVGDARCKGIKPTWGHIGVDRLCALYERSDLLIGVDSGPFHVAALTNIKALGIFRSLHPVRVCLPNPKATYIANGNCRLHWQKRDTWNIWTYDGADPSAHDIVISAISVLYSRTSQSLLAGRYEYRRVGYDTRILEMDGTGSIRQGAGDCEQSWFSTQEDGRELIYICGKYGVICKCVSCEDGTYRGRWTRFEEMEVELRPIGADFPAGPCSLVNDGKLHFWTAREARDLISTYQGGWRHPVGSRGNGMLWLLDPEVERSDLDASAADHEDWMIPFLEVPAGGTVLDLASFIGTNAVRWAKDEVNVIAVEPIPANRDVLYRNLILNEVINRVTVIAKAFGRACYYSQMTQSSLTSRLSADGEITVQVTTVDRELLPFLTKLDLLKLDVEGAECDVIDGAINTISQFRPRLIIEVHSHIPGCEGNGARLSQQLDSLNYTFKRIWENSESYFYVHAIPNP